MLLPPRLLEVHEIAGRVLPRWLGARDEAWLGELLAATEELVGRPVEAADDVFRAKVLPLASRNEAPPRVVAMAWWVELRRWSSRVDAPVDPERARDVVFELAATMPRAEALRAAAEVLGVPAESVERSLFADRPRARLFVAPGVRVPARDLLDRCNVAVLSALLLRSTELGALLRADVVHLARHAKRCGLMATFDEDDDGAVRATVSGPLSVFHDTTKYGRALASFVPHLASARALRLSARVVLPNGAALLELDTSGPFAGRGVVAPAGSDARTARLARDLRRIGSPFTVEATDAVVRGEGGVLFPDLALVSSRGCVLVEVVSYWTPAWLARVLVIARSARLPLVVCVDEARGAASLAGIDGVAPFRGVIRAEALSACASRVLAARPPAGAPPPPPEVGREGRGEGGDLGATAPP